MIKQIKRFFKHLTLLDPQYSLNTTIVLLLSVVSFYTSFDGLRNYMFGNENESASWALLLLLAFLVFLIQLLLIVALMRLTQRISLGNKVSMLLLYMIAMGFSVFLSYSYWYQAIQADNYAYNNFNVQLDDSLSDVGIYQDTFSSIKKIATELAEYSQETALLEKNRGRTCGDNSSPGAGPRLSLRNSEENLFTAMNTNISLLNDEVMQKINNLDSIRYGYSPDANIQELQKAMNVVISEVNRYKQNPDLVKAKKQLKEHSGENRNTLSTTHNGGNRTVSCPDNIITQKSKLLLERINDLPVLKNIRLFNSQDQREVMERALKVFLVIPAAVKQLIFSDVDQNKEEKGAEAVKSSDFTPLILGVMIDLIIFFVGYGNGKHSQQRNYLSGKYHGQHFSVTDAIKINHVFNIKELRENLQWYHHQLGRKHLIIIPSDNYRQSNNLNKRNLVSLMESLLANRRLSLQALRVPFETLPKNMRRRFAHLPKNTLFEFYHTTEEQWFDLLQSLEADEILTSKNATPQEMVISTLEHHQIRTELSLDEDDGLSLRENIATEDSDNPAFKPIKDNENDNKDNASNQDADKDSLSKEEAEDKKDNEEKLIEDENEEINSAGKEKKVEDEKESEKGQSSPKVTTKKTEEGSVKAETSKENISKKKNEANDASSKEINKKPVIEQKSKKERVVKKETGKDNTIKESITSPKMKQKDVIEKDIHQGIRLEKKKTEKNTQKTDAIEVEQKKKSVRKENAAEEKNSSEKEVTSENKASIEDEIELSKEEKIKKNRLQRERLQKRMRQLSHQQQRSIRKRGR